MNAFSTLALIAAIALPVSAASAQEAGHGSHDSHGAHAAPAHAHQGGAASETVHGEVKKLDKESGKITLRHGELKNLGMPAMTMVFRAGDAAMLEQVKVGDKVKFVADKVKGVLTLVKLENVK